MPRGIALLLPMREGVGTKDVFCAICGARQPNTAPAMDYLQGISSRIASLLCYIPIVGWVAIVVLASTRFRHDTRARFNSFKGFT